MEAKTKTQKAAKSAFVESPAYYGVWMEFVGSTPAQWLQTKGGRLVHYPDEAIAIAHAEQVNDNRTDYMYLRIASAKPFLKSATSEPASEK